MPWNANPKDEIRYTDLINVVHLFISFLGPTCHFCNIQYSLPTSSSNDGVFMMYITGFILDAFCGREPSTIRNNFSEVKRNLIKCKDIGKAPPYPPLVTRPVKDILVMGQAVDMLMQSLYPGRLSTFANFDTYRSSWSDFSTFWKVYAKGVKEVYSMGVQYRRNDAPSKCTTQTIWFESFFREVYL